MPKKIHIFLLFLVHLNVQIVANSHSFIGIRAFSVNITDSTPFVRLHRDLYNRLQYEILPRGIKPVLLPNDSIKDYVAESFGSVESQNGVIVVRFCLKENNQNGEEIKIIPLNDQPLDDVLDLMALKIRIFLEQHLSGKLRISSTPMDCEILLNGVKIGSTPAEVILEKGLYGVRLTHQHLFPYIDSIEIVPGKESSLMATLRFKGEPVKPFLLSASFLTIATVVSWIVENKLHQQYGSLENVPQSVFNMRFNQYKSMNYVRIGILNTSIICWGATIFRLVQNKSLENKIFGKIN